MYAYLRAIPAVANPVPEAMKNAIPPLPMPAIYDEGDVDRPLPPEEAPDPDNILRGFAIQPLDEPADLPAMPVGTQALFGRGSYLVNAIGARGPARRVTRRPTSVSARRASMTPRAAPARHATRSHAKLLPQTPPAGPRASRASRSSLAQPWGKSGAQSQGDGSRSAFSARKRTSVR